MPQNFFCTSEKCTRQMSQLLKVAVAVAKEDSLMATLYWISENRLLKLAEKYSMQKDEK